MEQSSREEHPSSRFANGLKKPASRSNISRSTPSEREGSVASEQNGGVPATDGSAREKVSPPPGGGNERDGGHSGLSKLIPGARRRRRKKQETRDSGNGTELADARSEESLAASDPRRRSVSDPGKDPTANV